MASVLTPLLVSAWACSPSTGAAGSGNNGATGSSGGAGTTDPNGSGSSVGAGGLDPIIGPGGPTSGGSSSTLPDGGCFSTVSKAEQVVTTVNVPVTTTVPGKPIDMFIMYDQSGSMNDKTGSSTKWDAIKAALTSFVNSPASAGIGVGIQYFPTKAPPCTAPSSTCLCIPFINICGSTGGGSCTASDYSTPDVAIQQLPAVAPAIVASVNAHGPGGGTPTAPALQGAQQYALGWAAAHPDRQTIVVLATDGDPSGCTGNAVTDVAAIAAAGTTGTPSVETFVIGVGSSLTSLNSIAAAGGSGQAFIVDTTTGNATQQFLDAMTKIQQTITTTHTETHTETHSSAVPCEWTIPDAPNGQKFDKNKVNVDFASGGGASQRVGAVTSATDCPNVTNGWHYDDPTTPTKVLVCPQTCTAIQKDTGSVVNVVFGCATEIAVLH